MIAALLLAACAPRVAGDAPVTLAPELILRAELRPGDGRVVDIAVREGRIQSVLPGPSPVPEGARLLVGDVVTAGFVDAHAHPYGLGRLSSQLVLSDLPTYAATLAAFESAPGEGWIVGRGWDQNDWPDAPPGGWPLAADLDRHTGGRPAAVRRVDGHAVWLNTAALEASGVDASTEDPPGGRILRDGDGRPAGVLVDEAMALVGAPTDAPEDVRRWLLHAFDLMAQSGLTGAHDMGVSDSALAVYTELARSDAMPVRIWAYVDPESQAHARLVASGPWSVGRLHVVGVKAYADGALGSRGAWLSAPYADEPHHAGSSIHPPESLERWATELLAQGASLAVHAIGDEAVHRTLDAFEAARAAHPGSSGRLRVEHAQLVRPEDRDRFRALGVVASMQPTHATSDMPWAEDRVGADRIAWAYAWRTLQDAGADIAFGSDFPVESHRPALGLWSATRRTDLEGGPPGGWRAAERVSEDDAIRAFTTGAAHAVGAGEALGVVRQGAVADLTLWRTSEGAPWTPVATVVDGIVRAALSDDGTE